ncbi:MAG TPA: hypothetical protein VFZ23_15265 [Pyrinomonadaceae bacterium]
MKEIAFTTAIAVLLFASACQRAAEAEPETKRATKPARVAAPAGSPSANIPNLQKEILDERYRETSSSLGSFDFKNFTYPLPRGWQNPDGSDLQLVNGRVDPVSKFIDEDMADEEKIEARAMRRIGMSYVTTKYLDVTGDGQDEAIVVLKVETTGNAIPQLVYIYEWKDEKPELLWNFRTGDRADGGLKDMRVENGELVVELFGQDRFLLGETETGKITGDEEQLCCPTYFTRTFYKWNGKNFLMQRKRLTYSVADPSAPPLENYGDVVNNPSPKRGKK